MQIPTLLTLLIDKQPVVCHTTSYCVQDFLNSFDLALVAGARSDLAIHPRTDAYVRRDAGRTLRVHSGMTVVDRFHDFRPRSFCRIVPRC